MKKINYDSNRCKGCHFCVNACAKKAITITDKVNSKGYTTVEFNDDKCVSCGSCYKVCPDYAIEVL